MLKDLTICGTPNETQSQLQKFSDVGIDLPIIQFNPTEDVKESFNLFQKTFFQSS